jgi:tRNA A37 methylthiotransferase MiaB
VGLSSDFIVGFPTETEEDFEQTLRLLDRVQFDNIYAFAYSPRPGTKAVKMRDDVPLKVKKQRLNRLLNHQLEISGKRYAARVGKVMEVLVEGESKNQKMGHQMSHQTGQPTGHPTDHAEPLEQAGTFRVWTGKTSCFRVVNFMTNSPRNLLGKLVALKITGASGVSLKGELVNGELK